MRNAEPCFAILREDFLPSATIKDRITVKEIVWDLETAKTEVERLNSLNKDKRCHYWWTPSRAVLRGVDQAP